MKKTLIVAAFAVVGVVANAQSFTESFDNVVVAGVGTGTVTSDNVWDFRNDSAPAGLSDWFNGNLAVFGPQAGAGYVGVNFQSTSGVGTISNWLMSQVRTFNNGDTISFYTRTVDTPFFPDRLHLKLSTSGASTAAASFSTNLVSVNNGLTTGGYPNTWTQFSVTLTGLGGPTSGRFAFHYDVPNGGPNGANSDYIGVDTVAYTAVPEPATMAALGLGVAAMLRRRRK